MTFYEEICKGFVIRNNIHVRLEGIYSGLGQREITKVLLVYPISTQIVEKNAFYIRDTSNILCRI